MFNPNQANPKLIMENERLKRINKALKIALGICAAFITTVLIIGIIFIYRVF